jgi:hypothetical protein
MDLNAKNSSLHPLCRFTLLKVNVYDLSIENQVQRGIMMNQQTATLRLPALGFLTILFLWCPLAIGQMGTRNLSGTVTDHHSEPLKGAVVQVENSVTMGVVSYITTRNGKYDFKHLDGDTDYRVWVNFRGRKSKVRQLSEFDSNRPKTINFIFDLH